MFSGEVTPRAASSRSSSRWRSAARRRLDCSARIRAHDTDARDESRLYDAFRTAGCHRAKGLSRQLGKLAEQVDRPQHWIRAIDRDRPPDGAALGHWRGGNRAGRRLRPLEEVPGPTTALKVVDGRGFLRVEGPFEEG